MWRCKKRRRHGAVLFLMSNYFWRGIWSHEVTTACSVSSGRQFGETFMLILFHTDIKFFSKFRSYLYFMFQVCNGIRWRRCAESYALVRRFSNCAPQSPFDSSWNFIVHIYTHIISNARNTHKTVLVYFGASWKVYCSKRALLLKKFENCYVTQFVKLEIEMLRLV